jgi:hypothetical protein
MSPARKLAMFQAVLMEMMIRGQSVLKANSKRRFIVMLKNRRIMIVSASAAEGYAIFFTAEPNLLLYMTKQVGRRCSGLSRNQPDFVTASFMILRICAVDDVWKPAPSDHQAENRTRPLVRSAGRRPPVPVQNAQRSTPVLFRVRASQY